MSSNPVPTSPTSRRRVLCGLAVALAVPAGVAGLAACSSPEDSGGGSAGGGGGQGSAPAAPSSPSAPSASSAPPAGTPLSRVPVGGGVVVEAESGPVVIVQPTPGTVKAFSAVCPHQGATVNAPAGGIIRCPRHGSEFDPATGAVKEGPADSGLDPVQSRVQDGVVVLS